MLHTEGQRQRDHRRKHDADEKGEVGSIPAPPYEGTEQPRRHGRQPHDEEISERDRGHGHTDESGDSGWVVEGARPEVPALRVVDDRQGHDQQQPGEHRDEEKTDHACAGDGRSPRPEGEDRAQHVEEHEQPVEAGETCQRLDRIPPVAR